MSNLWFFRLKKAEQQRRRSSGEQSVGSHHSVQSVAGLSAASLPIAAPGSTNLQASSGARAAAAASSSSASSNTPDGNTTSATVTARNTSLTATHDDYNYDDEDNENDNNQHYYNHTNKHHHHHRHHHQQGQHSNYQDYNYQDNDQDQQQQLQDNYYNTQRHYYHNQQRQLDSHNCGSQADYQATTSTTSANNPKGSGQQRRQRQFPAQGPEVVESAHVGRDDASCTRMPWPAGNQHSAAGGGGRGRDHRWQQTQQQVVVPLVNIIRSDSIVSSVLLCSTATPPPSQPHSMPFEDGSDYQDVVKINSNNQRGDNHYNDEVGADRPATETTTMTSGTRQPTVDSHQHGASGTKRKQLVCQLAHNGSRIESRTTANLSDLSHGRGGGGGGIYECSNNESCCAQDNSGAASGGGLLSGDVAVDNSYNSDFSTSRSQQQANISDATVTVTVAGAAAAAGGGQQKQKNLLQSGKVPPIHERLLDPNQAATRGGGLAGGVGQLSMADSMDNLAALIPRIRVEFYNSENTLKEKLQLYFIKDHTVSLYVRTAKLILKVLACYLYVCRVIFDRGPAYAACYGCQLPSSAQANNVTSTGMGNESGPTQMPANNPYSSNVPSSASSYYSQQQSLSKFDSHPYDGPINFKALFWVDRGPGIWSAQTTIAVICFIEAILMQYLTYKNSIFSIISFHFTLELITNTPFLISIFWYDLRTLFVPGFLNCWLAKQCLEAMLNDLSIVRQSSVFSHRLTILSATVFCLIFTSACGFQHAQRSGGRSFVTIFESIYFVVVTFSTVGYGDLKPETWPSQLFIMVMICVALIVLPTQFEQLAYFWIERKKLGASYAHHSTRHEKHVVVCSTTLRADTIMDFLNEFYAHPLLQTFSVVLLSPCELDTTMKLVLQTPTWNNRVVYIQGSALKATDLIRARMQSAEACFILAARNYNDRSAADEHTILRSWAIRDFSPYVPQYVQIFRTENKIHVAFAEHVVCDDEFKYALLANNCLIPGTSTLVTLLLHTSSQQARRRRRRRNFYNNLMNRFSSNQTGGPLNGLGYNQPNFSTNFNKQQPSAPNENNSGLEGQNSPNAQLLNEQQQQMYDEGDDDDSSPEWKRLYGKCSANEIYHIRLSDSRFFGEYQGKSFTYASFHSHRKFGVALIGVQTDMRGTWPIMLNPGPSYVLKSSDILFYINITKEENSTLMPMIHHNILSQQQTTTNAANPMGLDGCGSGGGGGLDCGSIYNNNNNNNNNNTSSMELPAPPPSSEASAAVGLDSGVNGGGGADGAGCVMMSSLENNSPPQMYIRVEASSPTVNVGAEFNAENEHQCASSTLDVSAKKQDEPNVAPVAPASSSTPPVGTSALYHSGPPTTTMMATTLDNTAREYHRQHLGLKKHSIADGASMVARSLCSIAGVTAGTAATGELQMDARNDLDPMDVECTLELQNLTAKLLAKRNSSASTGIPVSHNQLLAGGGAAGGGHRCEGGIAGGSKGGAVGGLGSRHGSTLELTSLRKGSNMSITSTKSRDASPTRLKQVVSGLAVKMKRVKLGKSLTHLTIPRMDLGGGGSSASSTESFVNARGRRPSIAPVPAMMGESEEHDSDHEREQESYFAMSWHSTSEQSPIVKKFVFCTTYVGVSPTLCYMLQRKKSPCCLQLIQACEHCPYKNARQYNWPNRCIILASDFASNGIYNFLVPLRAHFHNPNELRPIVLLLERKPTPQFIDAISWFPMVYWMPGSIDCLDDLIKAGINLAHSVVVTNKESTNSAEEDYLADCNTIVAVQTMFKMFPSVGIITELSQSSNMRFMQFRAHDLLLGGLALAAINNNNNQTSVGGFASGFNPSSRLHSRQSSTACALSGLDQASQSADSAGQTSAAGAGNIIRDRMHLRKLHSQYYSRTMGKEANSHAYKFRLPFAAGNVFSASMLDTLLYQAFVKDYMITMVRLLLGIDQAPGSGFLSSMRITKEELWIRTYGRLYQRLCSTTCEIPLGIYRTEPLETHASTRLLGLLSGHEGLGGGGGGGCNNANPNSPFSFGAFASQQASYEQATEELERIEISNMVKNRLQDLGMNVNDYDDSSANRNNTFSYVIINPNCDVRLREGDIIYLIRPSPIHSRKLFMHRANSVRHTDTQATGSLNHGTPLNSYQTSKRESISSMTSANPMGLTKQTKDGPPQPRPSQQTRTTRAAPPGGGIIANSQSAHQQPHNQQTCSRQAFHSSSAKSSNKTSDRYDEQTNLYQNHQQQQQQQTQTASTNNNGNNNQPTVQLRSYFSDGDFSEVLIKVDEHDDNQQTNFDAKEQQQQHLQQFSSDNEQSNQIGPLERPDSSDNAKNIQRRRSSCSDAEGSDSKMSSLA